MQWPSTSPLLCSDVKHKSCFGVSIWCSPFQESHLWAPHENCWPIHWWNLRFIAAKFDVYILLIWFLCTTNISRAIHRGSLCSDARTLVRWPWLLRWRLFQWAADFSRATHRGSLCSDARTLVRWPWLLRWRLFQWAADFSRATHRGSCAGDESPAYLVSDRGHTSALQISADQSIDRDHSSLQLQQIFDSRFVDQANAEIQSTAQTGSTGVIPWSMRWNHRR